jgi:opacity protein-like surface antigen
MIMSASTPLLEHRVTFQRQLIGEPPAIELPEILSVRGFHGTNLLLTTRALCGHRGNGVGLRGGGSRHAGPGLQGLPGGRAVQLDGILRWRNCRSELDQSRYESQRCQRAGSALLPRRHSRTERDRFAGPIGNQCNRWRRKAGYNQQWGSFVAGVEGDISWRHFSKTVATAGSPFLTFPFGTAAFTTTVSTNWLATIRPRIGYAVDKALFYATGGVAIGDVKYSNSYVGLSPLGFGLEFETAAASQTRVGWTVGAGIDYAVTPHWVVSGEYLHVDLGSLSTSGLATTGSTPTATFNVSTKLRSDIGRLGIAYKF